MDGEPIHGLSRLSCRRRRARRVQRKIHVQPVRSAGRLLRNSPIAHPRQLPQLFSARRALAILWDPVGQMSALTQTPLPEIAADVFAGLSATPKSLPPKLFYDARGSALFEKITR